jgi:hypothetical protein
MSKIREQIDSEVGAMQAARPGAPASTVGLDENGRWEAKDGGALSPEDIADLDALRPHIFGDELQSIDALLKAPPPDKPSNGEEMENFRDYLKATRRAKARRQQINTAPTNEAPDV